MAIREESIESLTKQQFYTLVIAMMGVCLGAYLPTQRTATITLTVFFRELLH
jgi:hypothetical protein